jgi:RNA polymerase sigma-70 factor, ECF subfamily
MTKTGKSVASKLDELHARYSEQLRPLARKLCQGMASAIDPNELVQEALLRFHERFEALGDAERAEGWLVSVMTRYFYDQLRKVMSRQKAEDDPTITRWTFVQEDVPSTYERITPERFKWAIEKLPEQQRITYLLHCQGLGNQDIASKLGISVGAVGKRLFDARKNLRGLLQPYVEEGIH